MKRFGIVLSGILALSLLGDRALAAEEKANPGKALFVSNKCMACHTISSEGIEKAKVAEAEGSAEGKSEDAAASKKGPPDLSSVGLHHDAAWLGKYLLKLEAKEGKKHLKKFRGTDAELGILTTWLASLKKDAGKKGDAPAGQEKKAAPDAKPSDAPKDGAKEPPPTPEGGTSKGQGID